MHKYRSLILLLLLSAVILVPLKLPACFKQPVNTPIALGAMPCSVQKILSASCSSFSFCLQEDHQFPTELMQRFAGLLCFLLVFIKYTSPLGYIYRPPR